LFLDCVWRILPFGRLSGLAKIWPEFYRVGDEQKDGLASSNDRALVKSDAHILIVDDDKGIRDLLQEFFQKRGLHTTVAADGTEMEAILRRTQVDLIILDVMLPGKSGLELCRDIRANYTTPIIMLTAVTETTDRVVGLEMGADDYMTKPFGLRELLSRVKALLGRTCRPVASRDVLDNRRNP